MYILLLDWIDYLIAIIYEFFNLITRNLYFCNFLSWQILSNRVIRLIYFILK